MSTQVSTALSVSQPRRLLSHFSKRGIPYGLQQLRYSPNLQRSKVFWEEPVTLPPGIAHSRGFVRCLPQHSHTLPQLRDEIMASMMWCSALLLTFAGMAGLARAQQQVAALQPFTTIRVCTPFNVLIAPAQDAGTPYAVYADADQGVKNSLNATVTGGVLTMATAQAAATQQVFSTDQPIKVTITYVHCCLPANG